MMDDMPKIQVICSTQNQMVNYVPIRHFNKAERVINLTLEGDKRNQNWDKYLQDVLGHSLLIESIPIDKNNLPMDAGLEKYIAQKLKEKIGASFDNERLLWNITGGQRYLTLAMSEIFRKRQGDVLCYFEGNSNEMLIFENTNGEIKKGFQNYLYANINDITVETALKLMGFKVTNKWDLKVNFKNSAIEGKNPDRFKDSYYLLSNDGFRKQCLDANKKGMISFSLWPNLDKELKVLLEKEETGAFGKPFEYMIATEIKKIITDNKLPVNEMIVSQKINFEDGSDIIDEFDIILATSSGKVLVFELKTGAMSSDVAKSTKYSTYAVGGVYGMPILIVPLKEAEIATSEENWKKIITDDDIYKTLKSTIRAANRANLEIWGFDKLEKNLKNKFPFNKNAEGEKTKCLNQLSHSF